MHSIGKIAYFQYLTKGSAVLSRRAVTLAAGSQTITLDGLPGASGIYYVRLSGSDGFLQTLAFEKM